MSDDQSQTTIRRTKNQDTADRFDLDLFRLIDRASEYAETNDKDRKAWHAVWCNLRSARRSVRPLMHPHDRENTE